MRKIKFILQCAIAAHFLMLNTSILLAQSPEGMPPTIVETTQPTVETAADTIHAVGSLLPAEHVTIRPEIAGKIEKIHFEEGQVVKANAPLFTLSASSLRAGVEEWQAQTKKLKREVGRAQDLVQKELVSQNDLESGQADLAIAQARLSLAQTQLAKTVIHAPFTGVTGFRAISVGEYVQAGDMLVNLVQLDPIKVEFQVPEIYLNNLSELQSVEITSPAFPDQSFTGEVYAIDPQLDHNNHTVGLRATLDNAKYLLKPGLFADVHITLTERKNALFIPEQALWPQGQKMFVYTVVDGNTQLTEVTLGLRRAGSVEVISGLTADSQVVTAGQIKIGSGMPVQTQPMPNSTITATKTQ